MPREAGQEAAAQALTAETSGETQAAMRKALTAPRDGSPETVEAVGAGWVAEEALAVALYAGLCTQDFEHGLRIAVIHSGDSDSTGAIAGNLPGLLFPEQVMAHRWRREIECADLILRIADDLSRIPEMDAQACERLWDQYPGW